MAPVCTRMVRFCKPMDPVLQKSVLLRVEGGLGEVGGAAEVAPVVLVGAEGEDFLALGSEAEVRGDDGKDAFFGEQGEEAGGDEVDAREGEGLQRRWFRDLGKWRVASGERRTAWLQFGKSRFRASLGMTIVGGLGCRWGRG